MVFTRASLLISAALVLGSAGGALAADLGNYGGGGGGGSLKDGPMMYQASGPSWYVRADGGYSVFDEPEMTEAGIYSLTDESIDSTWSFGGGVGRYFGHGLRGDLTWDHRFEADAQGNLADHAANLEGVRHFGVKSDVFLANMYYDLDWGNRFTPYVGLGLGFTKNKTTEGTVESCDCKTASIASGSETHVAGAAMAGVQLKLRERLSLDMGYRFLYLGSVETGAIVSANSGTTIAEDPTVEDIHAHEFRFGMRYDIN
jgi:opacity protein-like surface antigen